MDEKEVRRVVKDYSDMIKRISYNYLQHTYDCDDIYLNLPGDERPTEEELQRTETDEHFFISDGSDERYTSFVSGIDFEINGIAYVMIGFDVEMTADELFEMAEEIIAAR